MGRDGSIDWCCFPRFDSGACFAALLGDARARPLERRSRRRASARSRAATASDTLILETVFETDERRRARDRLHAAARRDARHRPDRRGARGRRCRCAPSSSSASTTAASSRGCAASATTAVAIAGPDALCFRTPVDVEGIGHDDRRRVRRLGRASASRSCSRGSRRTCRRPTGTIPRQALDRTPRSSGAVGGGVHVRRRLSRRRRATSLLVLKALTYAPTGGIVAAPTTSLPEWIGGARNWDYRYCWLRDATLTLVAMLQAGYDDEAVAWRDWLLRAVAGDPADIQIMYGIAGERRLDERELEWLPGYEDSQTGADRQRRVGPAPARRLRRGDRRAGLPARGRRGAGRASRGGAARDCSNGSRRAGADTDAGHLGGARARAPLHPLEGDGLGRVRPGDPHRRGVRHVGPGRPLARDPRRDPPRGARARLERAAAGVRAVVRLRRARRERAADARSSGSCRPTDPRMVSTVEAIERSSCATASCSATCRARTAPSTA